MSLRGRQPLHVAVQLGSLRLQARVGRHWSPGARGWAWPGRSYRCGRSSPAFPLGLAALTGFSVPHCGPSGGSVSEGSFPRVLAGLSAASARFPTVCNCFFLVSRGPQAEEAAPASPRPSSVLPRAPRCPPTRARRSWTTFQRGVEARAPFMFAG